MHNHYFCLCNIEYGEGGQVSPCGDAYSFGIVILELFTGMVPTHDMFRDGLTLQKHVKNVFPGILMKIVDPILLSIEGVYTSKFAPWKKCNGTYEPCHIVYHENSSLMQQTGTNREDEDQRCSSRFAQGKG